MSLLKSTILSQKLWQGKKNILILGVITFLVVSFWGLHSMSTDESEIMVNCPFMQGFSNFCQMNVSEHISQWKQLFTVIQAKNLLLFLSTLLVLLPITLFTVSTRAYERLKFQLIRNYLYRHKPEIKLFNYLVIAFSQGDIHSQVYA